MDRASRFHEKYQPVPESGCWLWTHGCSGGYGEFWDGGRMQKAHRISWELHKGAIPHGGHVLHKCDTPACVNPAHLFLGTHDDNMSDKREKGRAPKGEAHRSSKLSDSQVVEIRCAKGSSRKIAKDYGITHSQVLFIKKGLSRASA